MMKLSTLWKFDRTIAPDGSSPIALSIAQRWRHDAGSVRFFRSSANTIYTVNIDGERSFLRCAAVTERTCEMIEGELAIIDHARAAGISVVRPIPSLSGNLIETVDTDIGQLHAVLFAGIAGQQQDLVTIPADDIFTWGATVGRLHAALATVPASHNQKPAAWTAVLDAATRGNAAVRREGERLATVLRSLPRNPSTYRLLHNDLELDNLIWHEGTATILDFDEYSDGWYLHDIAMALDEVFDGGETIDSPRVQAFLAGYRTAQPLDDELLAYLAEFSALTRLQIWVLLDRAIDLTVDDVDQDWVKSLIERLTDRQQAYEAELAAGVA